MTDQELNRQVAQAANQNIADGKIPDYCNDLNAIGVVVKNLPEHLQDTFVDWLVDLATHLHSSRKEAEFQMATASAKQRAEAYLRTLGTWKVES